MYNILQLTKKTIRRDCRKRFQKPVKPPNNDENMMIIHVRRSKNSKIPTTIIMIPPIRMMSCWRFLIHAIFVMKKERIKNGTANPNTYAIIYMTADSGLLLASVITADKIGPVQGVHPAAKPIPMRIDPKNQQDDF